MKGVVEIAKDVLDIVLKFAILCAVLLTLANGIKTNQGVNEMAKDLSAYKTLIAQPVDCCEEGTQCQ